MAIGLPSMAYSDSIHKRRTMQFGGYNHNLSAGDGDIWNEENISSDLFPILSPRQPRYLITQLAEPNGFYAHDGLYWVDGTGFYADGAQVAGMTLANNRKTFASLGAYIVILPDKVWYNRLTGEYGSLEASWSGGGTLEGGTYAGEPAEANTLHSVGAAWEDTFSVGDAVELSGCVTHAENNKTVIIREIDGEYLRFLENCFIIAENGDAETNLTLRRTMPELDYICENENRLWGCKEDTVYASKLGDIFNWNVFDGVSTDSYAANVGSAGDFTGCCSYLGYPCFFKEEHIYKVYGDKPSNYQVMPSASLGTEKGSGHSYGIAGEVLFYLSRTGIMAYSGGIPQSINAAFGTERYKNAVGGSDGTKYYVSMQDAADNWHLFCYDKRNNIWCREDNTQAMALSWSGELYCMTKDGKLWMNGNARSAPEGAEAEASVTSVAEFADFVEDGSNGVGAEYGANRKGTSKIQVRMELDAGASVTFAMQFDSDGIWREVKTLTTETKRSYYIPIIPRRSDHFKIRINGTGSWRLYSLVRESYSGSEL